MFHELEKIRPVWVEEILRAHMNDGFRQLRDTTGVPLLSGEHFYTRMEVNTYLRDNIFAVMQSDPVWCGGITEALRIDDLCEMYGVTFIFHGHSLMPADTCPYCAFLITVIDSKNPYFKPRDISSEDLAQ